MECSLPAYDFFNESEETNRMITACLVAPCLDYTKGQCILVRPPTCFFYHNVIHKRRRVIGDDGKLLYWDRLCASIRSPGGCPSGDACVFAHSKTEVTYHPAKFRTRLCNSVECRGVVCCFAHSTKTFREGAYMKYSIEYNLKTHVEPTHGRSDSDDVSTVSSLPSSARAGLFMITQLCESFAADTTTCVSGQECYFAHSISELLTPLLDPGVVNFYPRLYKTQWCPCNQPHDWSACIYGHCWSDIRRPPGVGYGPVPCPAWEKSDPQEKYLQRCNYGLRCPFAHGIQERVYHPWSYKVDECSEYWGEESFCSRMESCALFHEKSEKNRNINTELVYDYDKLLDSEEVDKQCAHMYCKPIVISAANIRAAAVYEKIH